MNNIEELRNRKRNQTVLLRGIFDEYFSQEYTEKYVDSLISNCQITDREVMLQIGNDEIYEYIRKKYYRKAHFWSKPKQYKHNDIINFENVGINSTEFLQTISRNSMALFSFIKLYQNKGCDVELDYFGTFLADMEITISW